MHVRDPLALYQFQQRLGLESAEEEDVAIDVECVAGVAKWRSVIERAGDCYLHTSPQTEPAHDQIKVARMALGR